MKKYGVIYADPPWRYKVWNGKGRIEKHYPTMELENIMALPVGELTDKDCALFLWATLPMLQEALKGGCGFQVHQMNLVLEGVCPECQKKMQ